jgi:hypothetical protein
MLHPNVTRYNGLDISHRVSPNVPFPLDISYPDGQSVGIMVQQIRVVVAYKSETPVSWAGKIEVHTHKHTYIHTYIHTHTYTHIHTYIH